MTREFIADTYYRCCPSEISQTRLGVVAMCIFTNVAKAPSIIFGSPFLEIHFRAQLSNNSVVQGPNLALPEQNYFFWPKCSLNSFILLQKWRISRICDWINIADCILSFSLNFLKLSVVSKKASQTERSSLR